jgi:ribonuclease D
MRVFAALYAWRDRVAREEDESTRYHFLPLCLLFVDVFVFVTECEGVCVLTNGRYVLPNHMLFHISEVMPVDIPALLACCNPVPPLVRQHSADLATIIREARDAPDTPAEPRPSQVRSGIRRRSQHASNLETCAAAQITAEKPYFILRRRRRRRRQPCRRLR